MTIKIVWHKRTGREKVREMKERGERRKHQDPLGGKEGNYV